MTIRWSPVRLPICIRPVHRETVYSYLIRLARVNHINDHDFLAELVGTQRTHAFRDLERLAQITGYDSDTLTKALPELRAKPPAYVRRRHGATPACPQCTQGHPGGKIHRFYREDERICVQHQRWTGPGIRTALPHNLTQVPEVFTAARHHRRLRRQQNPVLVDSVLEQAEDIVMTWQDRRSWHLPVEQRLDVLHGTERHSVTTNQDAFYIALYPEVVTLTAILADPRWRRVAAAEPSGEARTPFFAEVARRLNFPHHQFHWRDPLVQWVNEQAAGCRSLRAPVPQSP